MREESDHCQGRLRLTRISYFFHQFVLTSVEIVVFRDISVYDDYACSVVTLSASPRSCRALVSLKLITYPSSRSSALTLDDLAQNFSNLRQLRVFNPENWNVFHCCPQLEIIGIFRAKLPKCDFNFSSLKNLTEFELEVWEMRSHILVSAMLTLPMTLTGLRVYGFSKLTVSDAFLDVLCSFKNLERLDCAVFGNLRSSVSPKL